MRSLALVLAGGICGVVLAGVPSKTELLFSWQANWTPLNDLELTFERKNGGAVTSSVMLRWRGAQLLARETRSAQEVGTVVQEASYDTGAATGRRLTLNHTLPRSFGWVSSKNGTLGQADWLSRQLRPPGEGATCWAPHMCLTTMLEDPRSQVRPQLETIDGRGTAVLNVFGDPKYGAGDDIVFTAWLDVERNAVPLQWVMFHAGASHPWITQRLSGYLNLGGTWLATRMDADWGQDSALPGSSQAWTVALNEGVPAIRVNAGLTEADCTVQFPAGCHVINEDGDDWFIVRGGNEAERLQAVYAAAGQLSPPAAPLTRWSTVGLTAVMALLAGAGLRFAAARRA